ncbi:hypothetical protein M0802_005748 [Mischocyttarus mexicanus]|nr:hypothetical protein M0802_005748 [Mischocyttarus mexicanus]
MFGHTHCGFLRAQALENAVVQTPLICSRRFRGTDGGGGFHGGGGGGVWYVGNVDSGGDGGGGGSGGVVTVHPSRSRRRPSIDFGGTR